MITPIRSTACMRLACLALAVLLIPQPSWALIDGLVSGARTVKDEAHKRIIENQLIQLVISAKKNYDASIKVYKEVRRLNEGRGLVRNVLSDLEKHGKRMGEEEREAFRSDFEYRGDSGLDRALGNLEDGVKGGVEKRGLRLVNRYATAVDKKSEAYAKALKAQGERLWKRKRRSEVGRGEGVKISDRALDLTAKGVGLQLQELSDSVEVLQELLALEMGRDAKHKRAEINLEKDITEALRFLSDRNGMAKALTESFYLVRLSRAPALLHGTRQSISRLVGLLLGLFLAAGFIYEFSKAGGTLPELLGLPLVFVVFGLAFYDQIMVSFAALLDAMEQTVSPADLVVHTVASGSSKLGTIEAIIVGTSRTMQFISLLLGFLTWGVLIVFLWVRFAFFCLLYAVGPLLIVCALFQPLRAMTQGWMMATIQVGLWGIFMRILTLVVMNSGMSALLNPEGGVIKSAFSSLVVNLVFLAFAVICPYFTHHLISGHIAEKGIGIVGAGRSAYSAVRQKFEKKKKGAG